MHRHFEDELETLRSLLIRIGSLVHEQTDIAIKAVLEAQPELAQLVVEREVKVNELDMVIENQCQRIFALSQPVAIDLRLLLAAMRMNSNLERIGDIAVNIAERVEPLRASLDLLSRVHAEEMMAISKQMMNDAFDAFIQSDTRLARAVFDQEDKVDRLGHDSFYQLIDEMKRDTSLIEPASHLMALLRHVERLADHATNIAEDVIFINEAKLQKHNTSGLSSAGS